MGSFCLSDDGINVRFDWVFHPEDEVRAITDSLALLDVRRVDCRQLFTFDPHDQITCLMYRASKYNLILAPWVTAGNILAPIDKCYPGSTKPEEPRGKDTRKDAEPMTFLKDSIDTSITISKAAVYHGFTKSFHYIEFIPLYVGQPEAGFKEKVLSHAACIRFFLQHYGCNKKLTANKVAISVRVAA